MILLIINKEWIQPLEFGLLCLKFFSGFCWWLGMGGRVHVLACTEQQENVLDSHQG